MPEHIRVVAIGDLHITERLRPADQVDALRVIAADIRRLQPHLVCVLGDLYGHQTSHRSTPWERNRLVELVQDAARTAPVVVLVGNHDNPEDLEVLQELRAEHPIHVLDIEEECSIATRVGRITLRPLPYPRRSMFDLGNRSLQEAVGDTMRTFASTIPTGVASLFLGHVQVGGCRLGGGEVLNGRDVQVTREQLDALPVDVALLGHIHLCQQVGARAWYAGSPWPQDFGETDSKGYLVVDIGGPLPDFAAFGGRAAPLGVGTRHDQHVVVTHILTDAPKLVTHHWRWGVVKPDVGAFGAYGWTSRPDNTGASARVHVKARLTCDREQKDAAEAALMRDSAAWRRDALSWDFETVVEGRASIRAPEVSQAVGLDAKLFAYWRTLSPPPSDAACHQAINALWDLQAQGCDALLAEVNTIRDEVKV